MGSLRRASKTTVRNVKPRQPGLPSLDFDVLAMLGIFAWGPINQPITLYDFDHAEAVVGPYLASYHSKLHLSQWFQKGRKAIIVRVVDVDASGNVVTAAKATVDLDTAATAPTQGAVTASSVGPYTLAAGDTLIASVDGNANQTLTFSATAAARESTGTETFALSDGQTLTVKVDRGAVQTIEFNTAEFVAIGSATAEEVAAVINAEITGASATATSGGTKITITSDKLGTDSYIEVTGGTANVALSFNVAEVQGTGNVADITSVSVTELISLCDATFTNGGGVTSSSSGGALKTTANTAGSSGSIQIIASSTADSKMGFDNATHAGSDGTAAATLQIDGKYYGGTVGNALSVAVTAASNGDSEYFDLIVYLSGSVVETFENVTMDSTSDDYVETVVNTNPGYSEYIAVTDKGLSGTATQRRPATVSATALTGGDDGLAGLADADFTGTSLSGAGLRAFDSVHMLDMGDILICPDRATSTMQEASEDYCSDNLNMTCVFIPDVPLGSSYSAAAAHAVALTASEWRTAALWPGVKVRNPDKAVYGTSETVTIGMSSSYAARMAENGQKMKERMFNQPGNPTFGTLPGVVGLESTDGNIAWKREVLAAANINTGRWGKLPDGSYGAWVDDVMSGDLGGNWKSVGEQRGVAHIVKTLLVYLESRRTQPNNVQAREVDEAEISDYLDGWVDRDVFVSRNPDECYYVNTDPRGNSINSPSEQAAHKYNVQVGLATAEPGRFVDLMITRDQRYTRARLKLAEGQS